MSREAGQLDRAAEIFEQARELSGAEREAFLRVACAGDDDLQREIESLLEASNAQGAFLGQPTNAGAETGQAESLEGPASVIDNYRLLQLIGEGGFGAVYLAEERGPVVRKVALKIIKLGMDTRRVIARFEAERQALAMMDHPNIARVLGAGAMENGRPYFVMELVTGEPITKYCDRNGLSIGDRLQLFAQVCHAVQHAHQKGIIHRDIKPSNVLVSTQDGKAFAKVIDFGIAKATSAGARLTEKTLFTEHRALIGTPEYMSPEQAAGSLDIDTRCDVYSLGVLLYELLTGAAPFDGKRLRSAAWDEMLRIIREEDPPRPSTRLSTLSPSPPGRGVRGEGDSSLAQIAAQRHTEPARLARLVHGDLDWIVMKCLEKNRARRYETANGLALDIERHLSHEPVEAGPPSRMYRMRKFVRRHRAGTAAVALVSLTILLGLGGTSWGILWALDERDRAREETLRADREATEANQQTELAERRAEQTQDVSDFLTDMLTEVNSQAFRGASVEGFRERMREALARQYVGEYPHFRERTPEEIEAGMSAFNEHTGADLALRIARRVMREFMLSRAAVALEQQFADQPLVRAQLHNAIGTQYQTLDLFDEAETHLRRALEIGRRQPGGGQEHLLNSLSQLAELSIAQGDYAAAEPLLHEAIALSRRVDGDQPRHLADVLSMLGGLCDARNDDAQAERLYREALATARRLLGQHHPSVAEHLSNLAGLSMKRADYLAAEAFYTEALAIQRQTYGLDHPSVVITLNNLTFLSWSRDDDAGPEPLIHVNPANGHRYCRSSFRCWGASSSTLGRTQPDWWDAQAQAQVLGGHLVTIDDAAENDWLISTFGPESFWIGLTDWDSPGEFHWVSGDPPTYVNWDIGQPDNAHGGGEDCVHSNHENDGCGLWNDLGEQWNSPFHAIPYFAIIELEAGPGPGDAEGDVNVSNAEQAVAWRAELEKLPDS